MISYRVMSVFLNMWAAVDDRQQVMPDVEYVINEKINIEQKMKERFDLLREHDALYR